MLRERIEERLGAPASEEPAVTTFQGLCTRLLHDEALEAGVDPFATPVSAADRLAMLLERIDELPLRHHDLRGNPSAVLGSIVGRIDRLKDELVTCEDYAAWASTLGDAEGARAAREREFGELFRAHDRMLADAGTLDFGDLVLRAFRLLREKPHVRARLAGRYRHVLVDDLQDTSFAQGLLLRLLVADRGEITAAGDDDQSIHRFRGASTKAFATSRPSGRPRAWSGWRSPSARASGSWPPARRSPSRCRGGSTRRCGRAPASRARSRSGRCASERAQAQAVAAEVERLIAREDVAPEDVCVLVRSVRSEGQAVAVALEERAVPYRLAGAAAFFQRAEVRDLLAWLRLLVDPGDAGAVVRALARPPVELRAIDLARVTQIARRRKLDMVAALAAALESPQIPPEARDRITTFLCSTARPRRRSTPLAPTSTCTG